MSRFPQRVCLLSAAALLLLGNVQAMDLFLTGYWSLSIGNSALVAGAGSDLASSYSSATDQVSLDIANTTGDTDNWQVRVRRSDTTWDPAFTLWVCRTGGGTGTGAISGGTTWQEVTATEETLFSGAGDRSAVDVQLRLTGVSVDIDPQTYASTVIYSVVDVP